MAGVICEGRMISSLDNYDYDYAPLKGKIQELQC